MQHLTSIIFVIVCVVSTSFAQSTCPQFTCAAPATACNSTTFCIGKTYCDPETSTCKPLVEYGEHCVMNADNSGSNCNGICNNRVCNAFQSPGTNCSSDDQCYIPGADSSISPTTKCVNNRCYGYPRGSNCNSYTPSCDPPLTCMTDGTCQFPGGPGAVCKTHTQCNNYLLCVHGTCSDGISITPNNLTYGDKCDMYASYDQCKVYLFVSTCTPTSLYINESAYCKGYHKGVQGSFCASDLHCGDNLYCHPNPNGNIYSGTCQQRLESTGLVCNSSSMCVSTEACECIYSTGLNQCTQRDFGNRPNTSKLDTDLIVCTQYCDLSDLPCRFSHCKNEYCRAFDFSLSAPIVDLLYPECFRRDRTYIEQALFLYSMRGFLKYEDCYLPDTSSDDSSGPILNVPATGVKLNAPACVLVLCVLLLNLFM